MTAPNAKTKNSVVYSFEGRWEVPLRSGDVRVFFRKRRPIQAPRLVFLYVGVPVKAIIGFAQLVSISEVTLDDACEIRNEGSIAVSELSKYIGAMGKVHALRIDRPVLFRSPFGLDRLSAKYGFNPPQSFSIMSAEFENGLLGEENEKEVD
jgi:predicted transcriptional regulator